MHNTHNFNDVKPRLRVGSAIQSDGNRRVQMRLRRNTFPVPVPDPFTLNSKIPFCPGESDFCPEMSDFFPDESSFFPEKSSFLPQKVRPFPEKCGFFFRKVRLFPRQIRLSPEKSDFFWTAKVAIFKTLQKWPVRVPLLYLLFLFSREPFRFPF